MKKTCIFLLIYIVCLLLGVTVSLAFVSCSGGNKVAEAKEGELSGSITISGAFALYPLAVKWSEEFQKLHPEVRIDLSAGGAGKGMTDVLADVVDLGMVSREVYAPELEKGAVPFASAKDAVVITINADNPATWHLQSDGCQDLDNGRIYHMGTSAGYGQ